MIQKFPEVNISRGSGKYSHPPKLPSPKTTQQKEAKKMYTLLTLLSSCITKDDKMSWVATCLNFRGNEVS